MSQPNSTYVIKNAKIITVDEAIRMATREAMKLLGLIKIDRLHSIATQTTSLLQRRLAVKR